MRFWPSSTGGGHAAAAVATVGGATVPFVAEAPALVAVPERRREGWMQRAMAIAPVIMTLIVLCVMSTYLLKNDSPVFRSPDENANHLFTVTFGTTGKLWYTDPLLQNDAENLLHPRGVLTHNGRAVPFNYLGLPVLYGALYSLLGEHVKYIAVVFAAMTFLCLYGTARELFRARFADCAFAMASMTPMLHYFNRPYENVVPMIAFFSLGVWMFVRYYRRSRMRDLLIGSAALAISMLFRYEYVLFAVPLGLTILLHKHGDVRRRAFVRDAAVLLACVAFLFVLPVLALDQWVYGDWKTYGYGLFNDVYFPSTGGSSSALGELARQLRSVLLPSPVNSGVVTNLVRFTFILTPVLTLLAITGIQTLVQEKRISTRMLLLYALVLAYELVYRGSSDTWQSTGFTADFEASIVRYWLPLYVAMFVLAVYALQRMSDVSLKRAVCAALVVVGVVTLMWSYNGNLDHMDQWLTNQVDAQKMLVAETEPNAVIYSGRSDKVVSQYRFSAAWWNGSQFYSPDTVSRSMARIAGRRPIYIALDPEVNLTALNASLQQYGLTATPLAAGWLARIHDSVDPAPGIRSGPGSLRSLLLCDVTISCSPLR